MNLDNELKIVICGSGLMGCGIAQLVASRGFNVSIYSVEDSEVDVLQKVEANLKIMLIQDVISEKELQETLSRLHITSNLADAVKDAGFVVECIPEDMKLKQTLFEVLDKICEPHVILATNTSVMSITEIAQKAVRKGRIIGTHFWNPAYLIPLVEVVQTKDTSEEVIQQTMGLLSSMGKHPIRVKKDVPGFVANRLQHALWREAISIVENGIADAKTVDDSIKYGFGMRLPILGPMENADMVGIDLTLSIHSYLLKYLENSAEPSLLLKELMRKGDLGFKAGKGFQEWTPEKIENSRKKLNEYLLEVTNGNKKTPIKQ